MTQLRVGLVGAGGITRVHVPAWLALGAHITVYSVEGAEELARRHGLSVADSMEELLASCDIVDICTPTTTHRDLAVAAAQAGKDVVCEKPLGRSVAEGLEIKEAVSRAGTQLYPGHVVRYFPAYMAAKEAIDQGRLGALAVLRFYRGGAGPKSDWFYDESVSGGIIADQMIHDLDQARWLAGEVTSVYAVQNAVRSPETPAEAHPRRVSAHVTLTHKSGAISHIQGVWGPPTMPFRTSFHVAGDAGALSHDSGADASLDKDLVLDATESYLPPPDLLESPFLTEIRDFANARLGRSESRVTLEDGVMAVGLADAALESVATGMVVPFSEASIHPAERV